MAVRSGPSADPPRRHIVGGSTRLPDLVHALDSGSRLVELAIRLPSGTTARLRARSCRYQGTIVWTSSCHLSQDSDGASDTLMVDGLLQRAKREFGTAGNGQLSAALNVDAVGS